MFESTYFVYVKKLFRANELVMCATLIFQNVILYLKIKKWGMKLCI